MDCLIKLVALPLSIVLLLTSVSSLSTHSQLYCLPSPSRLRLLPRPTARVVAHQGSVSGFHGARMPRQSRPALQEGMWITLPTVSIAQIF